MNLKQIDIIVWGIFLCFVCFFLTLVKRAQNAPNIELTFTITYRNSITKLLDNCLRWRFYVQWTTIKATNANRNTTSVTIHDIQNNTRSKKKKYKEIDENDEEKFQPKKSGKNKIDKFTYNVFVFAQVL